MVTLPAVTVTPSIMGAHEAMHAAGTAGLIGDLSTLFQTHDAWQWLLLLGQLVIGGAFLAAVLVRASRRRNRTLAGRVAAELETDAAPAWVVAGWCTAFWSLSVAFLGFVWDVTWHADTGRDQELFTVPHAMIIVGLFGIVASGIVAIWVATLRGSRTGWKIGRLRVPYSSVPILLLGLAAVAGFPLDDFWHATYGIDVTMWSPTHLLMIGGASLTPIALWLMMAEGGVGRGRNRWMYAVMGGIVLVGLSTFQLEYDLAIPQWQMLFQPMLLAGTAAFALVASRITFGRGGTLIAVATFLVIRGSMTLFIVALGHSLPKFPLYIAEALIVELVFLLPQRVSPAVRTLIAGLAVGVGGTAAEWGWTHAWYTFPWQSSLLPYVWMAVVLAVVMAVLGDSLGRIGTFERPRFTRIATVAALCVAGVLVSVHLPARTTVPAQATLHTSIVGGPQARTNSFGQTVVGHDVSVDLTLTPADAADNSDRFVIDAWQGHAPVDNIALVETSPGHYHATAPVPVGGTWKSLVLLARGDFIEAIPVAFPGDPEYGQPAIEPPASKTLTFVQADRWFMRETHQAAQWPFWTIVGLFALAVVAWAVSLAVVSSLIGRGNPAQPGKRSLRGRHAAPPARATAAAR